VLFDGWTAIDDLPYGTLSEHPDVEKVSRLVWGWAGVRLPQSGGTDTIEVLGVEFDSGLGLRFDLPRQPMSSLLQPAGHILIGEKDRGKLGVQELPVAGMEINGRKAVPVGFVPRVQLFTTASFALTDLENARAFLRMPSSHATYLVCKYRPGADIARVVADLRRAVPEHDVLTSRQFHDKASEYWGKRTSIGPLLLISSVLAVSVGFLVVVLAFYLSTVEKIPVFACMKALGASNGEILQILVFQSAIVFTLGCAAAGLGLYAAVTILAHTSISVVITKTVVVAGMGASAVASAGSSLLSVRRVLTTDPGEAFRT
jgi:putative ABC transport system permease protein